MSKKIGVIGCGWLGLPLAESLIAHGHRVSGTTTSKEKIKELENKGITPFKISISENGIEGPIEDFLNNCALLIINIPPGLRGKGPKESYISKIRLLHTEIKKSAIQKVIFISSTSVYGDVEGEVTEATRTEPSSASGKQILACEQLFINDKELPATIIRFAGLIGPDRHPVTILSGRENLSGGNAPVNLIHLEDCIGIIKAVITHEFWNELLNAVYPSHPEKSEYYMQEALKRGLQPPQYNQDNTKLHKKIKTCNIFLTNKYHFSTSIN
ncbi:MAG: SDR family oxidoreductase [Maribacter sp.]